MGVKLRMLLVLFNQEAARTDPKGILPFGPRDPAIVTNALSQLEYKHNLVQ